MMPPGSQSPPALPLPSPGRQGERARGPGPMLPTLFTRDGSPPPRVPGEVPWNSSGPHRLLRRPGRITHSPLAMTPTTLPALRRSRSGPMNMWQGGPCRSVLRQGLPRIPSFPWPVSPGTPSRTQPAPASEPRCRASARRTRPLAAADTCATGGAGPGQRPASGRITTAPLVGVPPSPGTPRVRRSDAEHLQRSR
jgi:hypothetical protein